jgi:glycosyltransferase involved in cell wall biosynthesis
MLHRGARLVHAVHRADGDQLSGRALVREPTLKAMDRIVAVSQAAADAFAAMNGVDQKAITVIHNGIDTERFAVARQSDRSGCRLCSIANLSHDKDPETLLEAFRLVREQRPEATLRIAGDGPRREEVERLVQDMGLEQAVVLDGHVDDVPGILAEADVLLHAAHTEGLGLCVIEAMAAGVPVVATGVGGLLEVVQNGETGLLVDPCDADAMASAALRLLGDSELRRALRKNATVSIERRFSIGAMCRGYCDLYRGLVAISEKREERANAH